MVLLQKERDTQYFILLGSVQLLPSSTSQRDGRYCVSSPAPVQIAASPESQGHSMRDTIVLGEEHALGKVESPH